MQKKAGDENFTRLINLLTFFGKIKKNSPVAEWMLEFCSFTLHRRDPDSSLKSQEIVVLENPADRCNVLQGFSFSSYFNLTIMKSFRGEFDKGESGFSARVIFLLATISSSFISSLRFSPNTKNKIIGQE